MIDLMRQSAVPSHIMRSAALGALSLPPAEMIEILVFLTANPMFSKQARLTLAGWDEAASIAVAADPGTPREVLGYLIAPRNRRPRLIPALLENPSVAEEALLEMAQADSREVVERMLASPRVRRSPNVLHALLPNPHLSPTELQHVRDVLEARRATTAEPGDAIDDDDVLGLALKQYVTEHAAEIAAEEGRPFKLVDLTLDEHVELAVIKPGVPKAAVTKALEAERLSPLQKIARMSVGDRVQLGMKGSRDERFILIRDGSRVVSQAVLESPKVGDQEIEAFASMRNVQESVLRGIAGKRKFMKNYAVIRALVNNPRTPLDISLSLMKNLLVNDLRNLSMNKSVPDTVRKVALKMYRERASGGKKEE